MTTPPVATANAEGCIEYLKALSGLEHIPSIFTLRMGRAWTAQPLPAWVARGPMRQCYENAGTLCIENRNLTYVEGYALSPGLPPIHHAWCVDADGCVIDNTFQDSDRVQYFGVPIRAKTLRKLVEESGRWGLFPEMMTPELLLQAIDEVQTGPHAVDPSEADAVRALITRHS
jgi:hypothetical protein